MRMRRERLLASRRGEYFISFFREYTLAAYFPHYFLNVCVITVSCFPLSLLRHQTSRNSDSHNKYFFMQAENPASIVWKKSFYSIIGCNFFPSLAAKAKSVSGGKGEIKERDRSPQGGREGGGEKFSFFSSPMMRENREVHNRYLAE